MQKKVLFVLFFVSFFSLKGQDKNFCLAPDLNASISTSITNPISIAFESGDDEFDLSINSATKVITIQRKSTSDSKQGYQGTYTITTQSGNVRYVIISPPDLDPVTFDLNCGSGNIVFANNLISGAVLSSALINGVSVLQADNLSIKIPQTGAQTALVEQKIDNWNGSSCSAVNSQKQTILRHYFNFLNPTGLTLCAGTSIPINGRVIQDFGGDPNVSPMATIKNPTNTIFSGSLSDFVIVPNLSPTQGASQTGTQNWVVSMDIQGCVIQKTLSVSIEQINANLAQKLIFDECLAASQDDQLVLKSGDNGILGDISIVNLDPDSNDGFSIQENTSTNLNGNYGITISQDILTLPSTVVFQNSPKKIVLQNKINTSNFPNLTVCIQDTPTVDLNFEIIKPTVNQVLFDQVVPEKIVCSGDEVVWTFNNPATQYIAYTNITNFGNQIQLIKQTNNNWAISNMPSFVNNGFLAYLGAKNSQQCRSLQKIQYGSINNFSDQDISVFYDRKIICGWPADATENYKYQTGSTGDGKIPLQNPYNQTAVSLFDQNNLLGASYAITTSSFLPIAQITPSLIFQEKTPGANTVLNPLGWIDLGTNLSDLGKVNYFDSLQKDANYLANKVDYGFEADVKYYYREDIVISSGPYAGSYFCQYPKDKNNPLKAKIYYGNRRVPEKPRLLLDPGNIELCPGITKTLTEITNQYSQKDGIPNSTGYTYNYNQNFTAYISTVFNEKGQNALSNYNENELKLKYDYTYQLTDFLSLCEASQSLSLKVDKTCRDNLFVLKDPIKSCSGKVTVKDVFDFGSTALAITDQITVLDPSNTTGADGGQFSLGNPNYVIATLSPSATGITYYQIQFELKDKTGVTYLLPNEDQPTVFSNIAVAQLQNTDFDYTPHQFDIAGLYPSVLSPLLSNNFSAGGIFTSNLPAGILDENSGQIQLQTFFQNLSVQNTNDLGPFDITYTSENKCYTTTTQISILVELKIFNGISPNGDGKNEVLWIENAALYPLMSLEIYDQNGRRVFYQKGYNNTFGGVIDGGGKTTLSLPKQLLPAGTYYYIIYKAPGFPAQKGNLYIRY